MYRRSYRKRSYRRRYHKKNQYTKKTRSRYQVAKIAQQVVNYNLETKVIRSILCRLSLCRVQP